MDSIVAQEIVPFQNRLNAHKVKSVSVGSPFDYKNNTLVYVCSDMPEPREPGYQEKVEDAIYETAVAMNGRTLVLFTSNKQLKETAGMLESRLQKHNILLLKQDTGVSRQRLTDQFRNQEESPSVLFGTRSFWEGVDVAGDALSAVISETFDNPFMQYAMPEAVLRFRQGFGRLIRRKTDEGVVLILDKRVITKRYGELFLNALPDCTLLRQRTDRIPEILDRWENRDRSKKR